MCLRNLLRRPGGRGARMEHRLSEDGEEEQNGHARSRGPATVTQTGGKWAMSRAAERPKGHKWRKVTGTLRWGGPLWPQPEQFQ